MGETQKALVELAKAIGTRMRRDAADQSLDAATAAARAQLALEGLRDVAQYLEVARVR